MGTLEEKTARVAELLEETMGVPAHDALPPLENLMLTILSQNTNDVNRDRAYRALRSRFPTWEEVMLADVRDVADAIRSAGLSNQKSRRMQEILRWIHRQYGALNLDAICAMPP